jgi:hypothetical protein
VRMSSFQNEEMDSVVCCSRLRQRGMSTLKRTGTQVPREGATPDPPSTQGQLHILELETSNIRHFRELRLKEGTNRAKPAVEISSCQNPCSVRRLSAVRCGGGV